jgi:hypothetical protein
MFMRFVFFIVSFPSIRPPAAFFVVLDFEAGVLLLVVVFPVVTPRVEPLGRPLFEPLPKIPPFFGLPPFAPLPNCDWLNPPEGFAPADFPNRLRPFFGEEGAAL